ncbi:MAG: long-chain fatty acid--CoA ligase [Solirubrobacterales bacterium]|nr:long-chain fatty acid--CoA ligase [Solirubrobacterales bacterium]MBV9810572.1 long-chain fatty acid--CoA ligase [Solirubrobacterales bacterium]
MTDNLLTGLMMDDFQLSLTTLVQRAERLSPERPVVSRRPDGSLHRTTMGECARRARRLAGALTALGVRTGDRVATLLWNQAEHLELYYAVPSMGAVIHTLNPRLPTDDLTYIAAHAADRVLVVDESLLGVLDSVGWAFKHVIVASRSGAHPVGSLEYESLIASARPLEWPPIGERRAAVMCYTSGTTGRPKGVVYSHRALVLHSLVAAMPDVHGISARDVILPAVPMFHVNAWGLPFTAALAGASLVLPGPRLDPVSILDLLESERVTFTAGVPTVWMSVLDALDAEPNRWDLSALRRVSLGGAALPVSLLEGLDRHGLTVVQGWGMTETSPVGTMCLLPGELDAAPREEQHEYLARQGVPVPFIELRARGEDGELVPWDDQAMGELEVRGPWVVAAYHEGTDADKFTADGWFRTGDIVRIDPRGCIRICDRSKDLVKSGGEWISSVDLENRLMAHRAVAEAAVIAVPDDRWGERPLAAVVLREGMQATPEELRKHLSIEFAKWQLPERIEFVRAIPRSATGKFKKAALREQFGPELAA